MITEQRTHFINICVNKERIEDNLKKLSTFGINKKGGIDRSFGSSTDVAARKWIKASWEKDLELPVTVDAAANLWIRMDGEENLPAIVLGSHHDAVANGGMYDGALGVILAEEVMKKIKEEKYKLRHPLAVVSFSAEEPNPFNISTLGSRSVSGKLKKEQLKDVVDKINNTKLEDAVALLGGDLENLDKAVIKPKDISAFIECHIEQGRRLYDRKLSLGVVTKITGIYREEIHIIGEANHAGTTLMEHRHDAMLAASEVCLSLEKIIKNMNRDDVVGTVGYIKASPNSANIIAEDVSIIVEIRATESYIVKSILEDLSTAMNRVSNKRTVKILRKIILNQPEVSMDETIRTSLKRAIKSMEEPFIEIASMAGHDSAHMAEITKTGMLFVPSIGGKSHCPDEKTNIDDIEKVGNALLQTVLMLDKELD